MTIAEIIAEARAELAAIEVNPLWGHEKQTVEIRKDALTIFDQMAARLESESRCSYVRGTVTQWCELAADRNVLQGLQAQLNAATEYRKRNPLGGPAVIFDSMADRVRAGEKFYDVLRDFGFQPVESKATDCLKRENV